VGHKAAGWLRVSLHSASPLCNSVQQWGCSVQQWGCLEQVASGIKTLHAMYGEEFVQAVQGCMEVDRAAGCADSVLERWAALLQSVRCEDAKQVKDALKALMRDKQGVVSRIPQRRSDAQAGGRTFAA
jgi:hypothetical protein